MGLPHHFCTNELELFHQMYDDGSYDFDWARLGRLTLQSNATYIYIFSK